MAKFMIGFSSFAVSTTVTTAMKAIGAAARMFEVVDIGVFGSGIAAAADVQHQAQVGFLSNAGAGTAGSNPTPELMEHGSAVSGLTTGIAYTAEPTTYATNIFPLFSFNQRGGMRWAVPKGEGFKTQGSNTNLSFGVRVDSSAAGNVDGNMQWHE